MKISPLLVGLIVCVVLVCASVTNAHHSQKHGSKFNVERDDDDNDHGHHGGHGDNEHGRHHRGPRHEDVKVYASAMGIPIVEACRGCVSAGQRWCHTGVDDFDGFCLYEEEEECGPRAQLVSTLDTCPSDKPSSIHACSRCVADAHVWCQDPHHPDCDSCGECVAQEVGCANSTNNFVFLDGYCPNDMSQWWQQTADEAAHAIGGVVFGFAAVVFFIVTACAACRIIKYIRKRRQARSQARMAANQPQQNHNGQFYAVPTMGPHSPMVVMPARVNPYSAGMSASSGPSPSPAPVHVAYAYPSQVQHVDARPAPSAPTGTRRGYSSVPLDEYA